MPSREHPQTTAQNPDEVALAYQVGLEIAAGNWKSALAQARAPKLPLVDQIRAATAVGDWAVVLQKEAVLVSRRNLSSSAELPVNLARQFIAARLKLRLRPQAHDLAEELADRNKSAPRAQRQLVLALSSLNLHEDALNLALKLWDDGFFPAMVNVTDSLLQLEEHDRCQAFLDTALGVLAGEEEATWLLCRHDLAVAAGNDALAAEGLERLRGKIPDAKLAVLLASEARRLSRPDMAERPLNLLQGWAQNPGDLGAFLEAGPSILHSVWECSPDTERTIGLLDQMTPHLLSPHATNVAANLLSRLGHDDRARELMQTALPIFPSSLRLWTKMLTIHGQTRDTQAIADLLVEMKAALPLPCVNAALLEAKAATWPTGYIPDLAEFAVNNRDPSIRDAFAAGLAELPELPDAVEVLIEQRVAGDDHLSGLRLKFALRRNADRRLLRKAILTPVAFADFIANRRATVQDLHDGMMAVTSASDNAPTIAAAEWLTRNWKLIDRFDETDKIFLPYTAESFADAATLTDFLVDRILRGEPTSVIRLGDCEAAFLPGPTDKQDDLLLHQHNCKKIWWGDRMPETQAEQQIVSDFVKAVRAAQVFGIMPHSRLVSAFPVRGIKSVHAAIEHGTACLANQIPNARVITSAHFHQDLDSWSLWDEIFASVKAVSWISCHDLSGFLYDVHGVETNTGVPIPSEQKYSGLFRSPADAECPTCEAGIGVAPPDQRLFDLHDAICADIAPQPGEVWLVAAGFLGKIYCDLICERGGIALDVGSIVDYWMGYSTRKYQAVGDDKLIIPAVLPIKGRNRPLPDPQGLRSRMIGLPGVARTARRGGWNIARPDEASPDLPTETAVLRVIGHPRCASGYMATVFSANGLLIGHEKFARDGISSWMYVVRDHSLPYGDNGTLTHRFRHTVLHLRDPADALTSIVLENGNAASFNFRRGHLLRATGHDIAEHADPLIRATASYVLWNHMALAQKPDAVIAVERAEEDVPMWLGRAGLQQAKAADAHGIAGYNSSLKKLGFIMSKPEIDLATWNGVARSLPEALHEGLAALCELGGYALPWQDRR